jgi:hypothetical protein
MKQPKQDLVGSLQNALTFAGSQRKSATLAYGVVKPSHSYVGRSHLRIGLESRSQESEAPQMSKVYSRRERPTTSVIVGSDAPVLAGNELLSLIIRRAFAKRSAQVRWPDPELSSRLSKAILCVIEQMGASGVAFRAQAQLLAARKLLAIGEPERDLSDGWGDFLDEVLDSDWTSKVTLDDFSAVGRINTAVEELLAQPQWSTVHDGHMAMSCVSILSFYDTSLLIWSMPQNSTVQ